MNGVKYDGFKLGSNTKFIAEMTKAICLALMVIALILMAISLNIIGVLLGIVGCLLLRKLFNPIINLHENTILFTTHEINKDFYSKKRRNSLIATIIFSVFFFLPTFSISLWVMIPQYVFLAKTKPLLQQNNAENIPEEQYDLTEITL